MGIHGLSKVIGDYAPSAVKENEIKNFFGEFIRQGGEGPDFGPNWPKP